MEIQTDLVLYTIVILFACVGGDWTTCPSSCKCVWSHGKKTAECDNAGFTAVPSTLSPELQILNLNKNRFTSLPRDTFYSVQLIHLHKIFLKNCSIESIDRNSLRGMKVLIEIDLSYNDIKSLDSELFKDCERIREVKITNNPIQTLENGLFSDLKYLQIVDFSNCQIHKIGSRVFSNVPAFTTLEFRGNRFRHLPLDSVSHLTSLKDFGLANNPWKCDCQLRDFISWIIEKNLYARPTDCKEPRELAGKLWTDVKDPYEFACKPEVKFISESNGIFSCQAEGDPLPKIYWTFNNKIVSNNSYTGSDYYIYESKAGNTIWGNLTIRNSRGKDSGEYKCIAENYGGKAEKRLEVKIEQYVEDPYYNTSGGAAYDGVLLVIGCIVGALLLIVIVFFTSCYFCRKRTSVIVNKKDKENTNGSVSHMIDSEEKSLINVINPVQKPPRRQDASLNNSETELHESTASQYNENGSILGEFKI